MPLVFGLTFSPLLEHELAAIAASETIPQGAGPRIVLTANVDHVVRLRRDPAFRSAYQQAWAITADGMPVLAYARLRGASLVKRVTGADLFPEVIARLRPDEHRAFFICSSQETGEELTRRLAERGFGSEQVAFVVPPFGFERDPAYAQDLALLVARHRTTHLFLGVGAPKSEIWIHQHRDVIGDCYAFPVGAALEFFAGYKRRAPLWMQRNGLEWLFRLSQEPKRLVRRYLIDSWAFLLAIGADLRASSRSRSSRLMSSP
jgi:N-acetylglucosaminyldiphosphoundecaprenol N-acetyl-beta-D-mannosaminyltransferase